MSRRSTGARLGQGSALLTASESLLLTLHLTVVAGFARLYDDGSFLVPLATFVLVAHVLAVGGRRLHLSPLVLGPVAVVGAVLTATWLCFSDTLWWGLPSVETWRDAGDALAEARDTFREVAAPAPVLAGFQLIGGLALWGAVWFADWAAFRLRTTVEAVAPATIVFVFGALLGSGQHRVATTTAFAAALLAFAAAHRALLAEDDHAWLAPAGRPGAPAVLRSGLALGVVALVAGVVVGPRLPGAHDEPLVHWRSVTSSGGQRTTVSPIVDLQKRLVQQSDVLLFRVTANRPAYWRLTALDRFDGQLWSSGGRFTGAGDVLPSEASDIADHRVITQRIEVDALAAIWVPSAYRARGLRATSEPLRWDPDSGTLIVDAAAETSDGLAYTVVSEAPDLDPATLRRAGSPDPADVTERYLALPADFPGVARRLADEATAGAGTRYDQARALQDWFRTQFRYSLDVPPGNSDDAMVDFLETRLGYCEQFAGTYAAMARSLGIPSRVAIGFTPGEADPDDPTHLLVRGRHAHAWPEVHFPGVGWVPFEPTPGRGIPDATDYTGVRPQQDERVPDEGEATTSTSSTTTAPDPGTTAPAPTARPGGSTGASPTPADVSTSDRSPLRWLVLVAGGIGAAWLAAVLAAPVVRRRGRRPGGPATVTVQRAWDDSLEPVRWMTRLAPRPAETHVEFARRARLPLADLAPLFGELTAITTRVAWDPLGGDASDADRATVLADELRNRARARQTPLQRARRRLSWREAFGQASSEPGASSPRRWLRTRPEAPPK